VASSGIHLRPQRGKSSNVPSGGVLISRYEPRSGDRYDAEMRTKLLIPALALVAILAACGGGSGTATNATNPTAAPATAGAATQAPAGGKVDCVALKAAAVELINVQFLAQLTTADTIAAVKAKQMGNLDLDKFLSAMHELHALDSYSSVLGDPKPAIDFYETAGKAAQTLFAASPVTQADIDTYNQNVGTVGAFLGHQIAISGAMDAAGC
jgi:hypothetical protein